MMFVLPELTASFDTLLSLLPHAAAKKDSAKTVVVATNKPFFFIFPTPSIIDEP